MPNPLIDHDVCWWCDHNMIDVEPDDEPCLVGKKQGIDMCNQCVHIQKQNYTIVTKKEYLKEFISPKERR